MLTLGIDLAEKVLVKKSFYIYWIRSIIRLFVFRESGPELIDGSRCQGEIEIEWIRISRGAKSLSS